jgi:hypothetical protein
MKETTLKYFEEVKDEIIKNLDAAISKNASNVEVDELLEYLFEMNKLIDNILK